MLSHEKISESSKDGILKHEFFDDVRIFCADGGVNYSEINQRSLKESLNGNHSSQYYVGMIYCIGKVVDKDYQKAMEWYIKSTNQGNSYAQFNIGYLYDSGQGVALPESYVMVPQVG